MNDDLIIKTIHFVKNELQNAEAGHDWWHISRVWENTKFILQKEKRGDTLVCHLAALLHDIADAKFHHGDERIGPLKALEWLESIGVDPATVDHVVNIISYMSFKNSFGNQGFNSLEMQIVQDADRLDAIGAIGVARAFHYGGYKNHLLYDPDQPPRNQMTKEEYKSGDNHTINHFYEKLLLLKDLMNTPTARRMAEQRHQFLLDFLKQFHSEWNVAKQPINQ